MRMPSGLAHFFAGPAERLWLRPFSCRSLGAAERLGVT